MNRKPGSQENEMTKQMLAAMASGLALMAAEAKATPVEPGQVANTLTLNFQYRLVK